MATPTLKYVAPTTPEAELTFAPEPVEIYGVAASSTPVTLTAVPASFADEAAVRAYLLTLVTELKSSPYFN
jgi:hypothetical protein